MTMMEVQPTSIARNIYVARRFVLESDAMPELLAPGCTLHLLSPWTPAPLDRHAFTALVQRLPRAIPGLTTGIEDLIAQGDTVVVRWTAIAGETDSKHVSPAPIVIAGIT